MNRPTIVLERESSDVYGIPEEIDGPAWADSPLLLGDKHHVLPLNATAMSVATTAALHATVNSLPSVQSSTLSMPSDSEAPFSNTIFDEIDVKMHIWNRLMEFGPLRSTFARWCARAEARLASRRHRATGAEVVRGILSGTFGAASPLSSGSPFSPAKSRPKEPRSGRVGVLVASPQRTAATPPPKASPPLAKGERTRGGRAVDGTQSTTPSPTTTTAAAAPRKAAPATSRPAPAPLKKPVVATRAAAVPIGLQRARAVSAPKRAVPAATVDEGATPPKRKPPVPKQQMQPADVHAERTPPPPARPAQTKPSPGPKSTPLTAAAAAAIAGGGGSGKKPDSKPPNHPSTSMDVGPTSRGGPRAQRKHFNIASQVKFE